MPYRYVTKNNLENPQNYMYSEYSGFSFLKNYIKSREKYISTQNTSIKINQNYISDYANLIKRSETFNCIYQIYIKIVEEKSNIDFMRKEIEYYIKVFEIRKRLYNQYMQDSYKPIEISGYSNYDNYLIFALLLHLLYLNTGNLKYLNSLLKVNDTLLSIEQYLNKTEQQVYVYVLIQELSYVKGLMTNNNLPIKEDYI